MRSPIAEYCRAREDCEELQRFGRNQADALALFRGKSRQEMPRERRNILRSLAQRRHRNRKHMQAIEQVLAETPGFHVGDQVAVGGRDDAHVDLDRLARADRLDFAFLDGAQQLDLRGRRQFADLVEEQRAARGFDELCRYGVRWRR